MRVYAFVGIALLIVHYTVKQENGVRRGAVFIHFAKRCILQKAAKKGFNQVNRLEKNWETFANSYYIKYHPKHGVTALTESLLTYSGCFTAGKVGNQGVKRSFSQVCM